MILLSFCLAWWTILSYFTNSQFHLRISKFTLFGESGEKNEDLSAFSNFTADENFNASTSEARIGTLVEIEFPT